MNKDTATWKRLIEPVAVSLMAIFIVVSLTGIFWHRHRLGRDIRVVSTPEAGFRVNVNRAGKEELMLLPGIGEARAERILAAREKGAFTSADEVRAASGLSEKQFQPVADLITLGESVSPMGHSGTP